MSELLASEALGLPAIPVVWGKHGPPVVQPENISPHVLHREVTYKGDNHRGGGPARNLALREKPVWRLVHLE